MRRNPLALLQRHNLLKWCCCAFAALPFCDASVHGGIVSMTYTELAQGTPVNLTTTGDLDWVKWGNSTSSVLTFSTVEKVGGTIINPTLTRLGTPPQGFTVQLGSFAVGPTTTGALEFSWNDGTATPAGGFTTNDTLVTEYLSPAAFGYPIGLGLSFTANAALESRVMDVYVQGFNADMLLTGTMSGGGTASTVVTPSQNPPYDSLNDYAIGRLRIEFSGAGETLTVSMITQNPRTDGAQQQFANAGVFAAAIGTPQTAAVPEPASLSMFAVGIAAFGGFVRVRRRKV